MLVANRKESLTRFSKVVKIPEMIISTLFLGTGIYMLVKGGHPEVYMMVKIVLVLVSIPLAVIGIKKDKKVFLVLSVVILLYVYGIAETRSLTFSRPEIANVIVDVTNQNYDRLVHGKAIYTTHCTRCHGEEGNQMLNDSPDLTKSILSKEERWILIENGKGTMPAFGDILNENEKIALEEYLLTFYNN